MEVEKIIIHLIEKEQSGAPTVQLSPSLLEIDENVITLATKLNEAFKKDEKVLRTEFTSEPRTFQIGIRHFTVSQTDEDFLNFAESSVYRMIDLLSGNTLATGGYFVFINYAYRNNAYVGVFIVRDEEEIVFQRDESNSFTVNTTDIVNTSKLAMAVRVDVTKLINNQLRYLHFTKRQSHLSQYFFDWIEASLAEKSSEDTTNLVRLINQLGQDEFPINPETSQRFTPDEFRTKLYDNILSSGRIVRIREISQTFWDNEDFLTNKIEELNLDISSEFQAPETILKRLKKYEIVSGKMKLVFSQHDISSGRISVGDEPNQLIIESEELARKFNNLT